jgi:hypothetical protein
VFEAGLKENVKDSLVHHDKSESLYALIELATRINNRLWERNDQKKYFRPNLANMKKQRGRYDKDGDVIMTSRVQDKSVTITKHVCVAARLDTSPETARRNKLNRRPSRLG